MTNDKKSEDIDNTSTKLEDLARYSKRAQEYMIWLDKTYRELSQIRENYKKDQSKKN